METENSISNTRNKPGVALKVGGFICNSVDKFVLNPPLQEEAPDSFKKFVGGVSIAGIVASGVAIVTVLN